MLNNLQDMEIEDFSNLLDTVLGIMEERKIEYNLINFERVLMLVQAKQKEYIERKSLANPLAELNRNIDAFIKRRGRHE